MVVGGVREDRENTRTWIEARHRVGAGGDGGAGQGPDRVVEGGEQRLLVVHRQEIDRGTRR